MFGRARGGYGPEPSAGPQPARAGGEGRARRRRARARARARRRILGGRGANARAWAGRRTPGRPRRPQREAAALEQRRRRRTVSGAKRLGPKTAATMTVLCAIIASEEQGLLGAGVGDTRDRGLDIEGAAGGGGLCWCMTTRIPVGVCLSNDPNRGFAACAPRTVRPPCLHAASARIRTARRGPAGQPVAQRGEEPRVDRVRHGRSRGTPRRARPRSAGRAPPGRTPPG